MNEQGQIKIDLNKLMEDYEKQSSDVAAAETAYLTAKTVYDNEFAKKSMNEKVAHPEESATDRKQKVLNDMATQKTELTAKEATWKAAVQRLKSIENRKQLSRDLAKLAVSENYALNHTGEETHVSKKILR